MARHLRARAIALGENFLEKFRDAEEDVATTVVVKAYKVVAVIVAIVAKVYNVVAMVVKACKVVVMFVAVAVVVKVCKVAPVVVTMVDKE